MAEPEPAWQGVRVVEVSAREDGQRIDNFLVRELKGVPKSRIYRMLRSGEVRLNGGRSKPADRLSPGDRVRLPPVRTTVGAAGIVPDALIERLEASVLLEDEQLLILNKPGGLAVHGGSGLSIGLIEALRGGRPQAPMLELSHRLDRDASGCLVIAKSRTALLELHALFRGGGLDKRYLALVRGTWQGAAVHVAAPLETERAVGGRRSVIADDGGRAARSRFTPLERFAQATLVEVQIETGRMHQIRAHAAHLGCPLAGDDKYGDFAFNRSLHPLGLKRLFLHARSLEFGLSGRNYRVQAPLGEELMAVLERLRASAGTLGADTRTPGVRL